MTFYNGVVLARSLAFLILFSNFEIIRSRSCSCKEYDRATSIKDWVRDLEAITTSHCDNNHEVLFNFLSTRSQVSTKWATKTYGLAIRETSDRAQEAGKMYFVI